MASLGQHLSTSAARIWLALGIFLLALAVVTGLLATGSIPGVPDAPLKPVSLYASPQSAGAPVTVYLQPPASTLQAGGEGQLLALQFSNRSDTAVTLQTTTVEPRNCFELHALSSEPSRLPAGQARVALYRLTAAVRPGKSPAVPACEDQVAANFRYSFQAGPPAASAATPQAGANRPAMAASGEGFISTSPIIITTRGTLRMERFFRIAAALTVPLLLGIVTFWFQQFQTRKADEQKAQELRLSDVQKEQSLKLEVWKMIFPIVNGLNADHYIQMIRHMDDVRGEMGKFPNVDAARLTASIVVLQAAYNTLYDLVGGFNFRNMPAEDIVGPVSSTLYEQFCQLAGGADRFEEFARAVNRRDKALAAANKLDAYARKDAATLAALQQFQKAVSDPAVFPVLDARLEFLRGILAFENNILWYPEWYGTPPVMNFNQASLPNMNLPPDQLKDMQVLLVNYRRAVPPECCGPA